MRDAIFAGAVIWAGLLAGYFVIVKKHALETREERQQLKAIFGGLALMVGAVLAFAVMAADSLPD